jgi:MarR family transcriptional regulator, temperature-dependent positive regulator of motility
LTKKATVVAMASRDKAMAQLERVATELDLQKLPGYLLRRLDSRAASLYEQFTGQSDLTPRQFGVLLTLLQSGALAQSELGNRLHLDRSTLGEMLQRMVERNLVDRRAHEHDRRAIEVVLTETGKKALLRTCEQAVEAQEALLSPLPVYLRPVFLKCLEILAEGEFAAD